MYEDSSDPGSHGVSLWGPEVDVEHYYCYTDTENDRIYSQILTLIFFRMISSVMLQESI